MKSRCRKWNHDFSYEGKKKLKEICCKKCGKNMVEWTYERHNPNITGWQMVQDAEILEKYMKNEEKKLKKKMDRKINKGP